MQTFDITIHLVWFSLLVCPQLMAADSLGRPTKPNIIVILADDMGYSDLGCTGSEIETPNLDAMADRGVLFTHFYNTSRCCPSRACLLTGQYQWDVGLGHMTYTKSRFPEYQQSLSDKFVTLPELLRSAGYQTAMSGKWHVGEARHQWPDHRGFDQFFGTPTGGGLYFYPSPFYDRPVFRNGDKIEPGSSWYSTDGFTDEAIEFLRNKRDKQRPFFFYLAYIAPHFPLQAKESDIEKYRQMYQVGYQSIRDARFEKQRLLGLVSNRESPSPTTCPDWSTVKNPETEALKMAVYAAQVDCLDQNVGRLMQALREEQISENTVVMFLSDNGGCAQRFNKTPQEEIGSRRSNASYGKWFNVSNTPYRMAKTQVHEGGVLTPLIFHWPAGLKRTGHRINAPAHIMDILPTCAELAGVSQPSLEQIQSFSPLEGTSFLSLIDGKKIDSSRVLYWEHEGNRAVRVGDWKLVSLRKKSWELYNLKDDPFEEHDLASVNPRRVTELANLYTDWANEHGVQPWPLKKK
ncbi:arylsulfatase [Rhodopirellula maiorica SM1]|uniref:Arylsulfatase n=1 Tax=Rhodopirellula maiorica SM1 TaxID=1265738 RepID=M5RLY9_9BACT|nr:arylsulfatase [Rhodopirellula maiorica]EMI20328.1 arylsulfatase [Rhodopirellula maiorica SM1]